MGDVYDQALNPVHLDRVPGGADPAQAEAIAEAFSEATSQELVARDFLGAKGS